MLKPRRWKSSTGSSSTHWVAEEVVVDEGLDGRMV